MTDRIIASLRERGWTPKDVVRALALDESILRDTKEAPAKSGALGKLEALLKRGDKPVLAQDAKLEDLLELLDVLKRDSGKAEEITKELKDDPSGEPDGGEEDEDEREDDESDDNPGEAENEEDDMEPNSGIPGLAGEEKKEVGHDDEANVNAKVAQMLMAAAKMLMGEGEEKPAEDEDMEGAEDEDELDERGEPKKVAKDEEKEEPKIGPKELKTAMDSAVKLARKVEREISDAKYEVQPITGELRMSFDSADEVYRHAAKVAGIDGADKIHASALPTLLKMHRHTPASAPRQSASMGMDAKGEEDFSKRFPNAARVSV